MAPVIPSNTPCRAEIDALQLRKINDLIAAIHAGNPFYRDKLRLSGIRGDLNSTDEYSEKVALTGKQELIDDQLAHPPFGTNLSFPIDQYRRFSQTSGTTGTPLRWLDTEQSWSSMVDIWSRIFRLAGVSEADRIFFPFSFGPFLGFWTAFEAAAALGCLTIPGGGMRSQSRLRMIIDNAVTVICMTPTYAVRLGMVAQDESIDMSRSAVKTIIVAGEPGGSIPATRELISRLWNGAKVVDHHGMTEVGPVSYQCPRTPERLHIFETSFFAELIDPDSGGRLFRGQTGELVLTPLDRTGSPLLRYRTHDLVRIVDADRCDCGSVEMTLAGGILGRTDDMVMVRGVNVYPSAIESILRRFEAIQEYQVEIDVTEGMTELRIAVELEDNNDGASELCRRIESELANALSLRIPVASVPGNTLPRFEMKAKRWVRR